MLRRAAGLAGILSFALLVSSASGQSRAEQQAAQETEIPGLRLLDAALPARLAGLGLHVGYVEAEVRPGGGRYTCGGLSGPAARAALGSAAQALGRLPDAALRRVDLRYLVLCSRATAQGQVIGGIPVPPLRLLMVAVAAPGGDATQAQRLVLHELYHLIELERGTYQDGDWEGRFRGYTNRYDLGPGVGRLGGGAPGFIDRYAQSFPYEDRAELFAALVLQPRDVAAQIAAKRDDVLRAKAAYMRDKAARLIGLTLASR